MRKMSVEQQIAMLRRSMQSPLGRHLNTWLGVLALILMAVGYATGNPILWMFAAFFGLVAVFEREAVPNIVAAMRAWDEGPPKAGWVSITVVRGDGGENYRAVVDEPGRVRWQYQFMPQGWTPVAGHFPARIWRPVAQEAPVMAAVEAGVMIPRNRPEALPSQDGFAHP
jgi:hypothetical protein